jgi:hypothetical protein
MNYAVKTCFYRNLYYDSVGEQMMIPDLIALLFANES